MHNFVILVGYEIVKPICPFCDEPVEMGYRFGGELLHDKCWEELQRELEAVEEDQNWVTS